jgi:hypothetical protein
MTTNLPGYITESLKLVPRSDGMLGLQLDPSSEGPVFGPSDSLTIGLKTELVAHWVAQLAKFTPPATQSLARRYLAQWPEGPQLG